MERIMKYILHFFLIYITLNNVTLATDTFTGQKKLACEALLCLTSGSRPSECGPSISEFLSIIVKHKPHETFKARKNFLNLCPSGDDTGNLTDSLANGYGKCDNEHILDFLNKFHYDSDDDDYHIAHSIPDYCVDFQTAVNQYNADYELPTKKEVCIDRYTEDDDDSHYYDYNQTCKKRWMFDNQDSIDEVCDFSEKALIDDKPICFPTSERVMCSIQPYKNSTWVSGRLYKYQWFKLKKEGFWYREDGHHWCHPELKNDQ